MNEHKFETVSSMADSHFTNDDCVDGLVNNQQLSQTWYRYHLIGDAIRDELPEQLDTELALNIANAIENEPTVLAPVAKASITEALKGKVVEWIKPFGQVAIAASAAGLFILNVQHNVADNNAFEPSRIVQTNPVGGIAQPVSLNYQQNSRVSQQQAFVAQQRRFQALLQDHKQQITFTSQALAPTDTTTEVEDTPK